MKPTPNINQLNIVILAAGAGKRMQSALPKVLHTLAGSSLLRHVINVARQLSPNKICIVIGHGGEIVRSEISDDDLIWVRQEQQLGTGHAVMQALPNLDKSERTLVLYGDVPLVKVETLKKLIAATREKQCALMTAMLPDATGYGRIVRDTKTKSITAIVEQKEANPEQLAIQEINTGIMLVPNEYLYDWLPKLKNRNAQQEYYLTDIIGMAAELKIGIASTQPVNVWEVMGVNNKCQLAELERIYQKERANELLEQGVKLIDPTRIDFRGTISCESDVEIDINCIFEGNVRLGRGVKIGANCILKNVTVAANTIIHPFCLIEEAEIADECRIGPFARIRPGTVLSSKAHIGNFVEVKNSQIGLGSKVNHLSYIGDSVIGKGVNIGAGTITCNYDGANKYQTVIEDDVFIGSDTQLIAPVRVSKGSTIGAGSTITKDTPEGTLTLARSKQISISGWKRPTKTKK